LALVALAQAPQHLLETLAAIRYFLALPQQAAVAAVVTQLLAHLEVLEAVIVQSLEAVAVLVLPVKGMLAALIQTQILSIVLAVAVVLVL
jgi:hypothetical protein